MESGDCGNANSLPYTSIFDTDLQQSSDLNGNDGKEDTLCNVNLGKEKNPKKVIHFSDGTIEEYSSEEDEPDQPAQVTTELNPRNMTWGPWMWYMTSNVGSKSLQVCDFLGEHLASFFGITTPKYQYEIDEYNRMLAEEEERQRRQDLEMGGWTDTKTQVDAVDVPPDRISTGQGDSEDKKF